MSETQERGVEWLKRNAREHTFPKPRDVGGDHPMTTAREYASEATGNTASVVGAVDYDGLFVVQFGDSDDHGTLLLKSPDGTYVGACDCEDYQYRGSERPCKHLCYLKIREGIADLKVPESSNKVAHVLETATQGSTQEEVETAVETVEVEEDPMPTQPAEPTENGSSVPQRSDSFAEPLPNLDGEQYVMEMNGETYIRRAGYARLGRQAGLSHSVELIERRRGEWVEAKATVTDTDSGATWEDYGTAHVDGEDMSGAEFNLVELAATRALTRAYAWATGEGLTAVAEVNPGGER